MDKTRIGIIGLGGMGSSHSRYLVAGEVPDAVLTAVADVRPERLEWAKANLPASVLRFATPEALIASKAVDGVLVATPHYDHPHRHGRAARGAPRAHGEAGRRVHRAGP